MKCQCEKPELEYKEYLWREEHHKHSALKATCAKCNKVRSWYNGNYRKHLAKVDDICSRLEMERV